MTTCIICGMEFQKVRRHQITCSRKCARARKTACCRAKRHIERRDDRDETARSHTYRRLANSMCNFVIVDPGVSDFPRGASFPIVEGNEMLRLGYFVPGMIIRKYKVNYRVAGIECATQELIPL